MECSWANQRSVWFLRNSGHKVGCSVSLLSLNVPLQILLSLVFHCTCTAYIICILYYISAQAVHQNSSGCWVVCHIASWTLHLLWMGFWWTSQVWHLKWLAVYAPFLWDLSFVYVCSWLLHDPNMKIRTAYPPYLDAVDAYLAKLLPLVADLQVCKFGLL